jgi:hypothetical protein
VSGVRVTSGVGRERRWLRTAGRVRKKIWFRSKHLVRKEMEGIDGLFDRSAGPGGERAGATIASRLDCVGPSKGIRWPCVEEEQSS